MSVAPTFAADPPRRLSLLAGRRVPLAGCGAATDHARALLEEFGAASPLRGGQPDPQPDLDWAACGAMALTGRTDGPPLLAPAPLASRARGSLRALAALAPRFRDDRGPALLAERAAELGLGRRGAVSAGGACRLLPAQDGWLAVHLARDDDRRSLPAWLETPVAGDPWAVVERRLRRADPHALLARARLLGMPVAPVQAHVPGAPWLRVAACGPRLPGRDSRRSPRVVDLSSLWAGPLCGDLLRRCGARVVKVESAGRPDAARTGTPRLFDRLHAGKRSVVLDFTRDRGRAQLCALLAGADIVVESARPRALSQLGIDAAGWVRQRAGRTWLAIGAYGRAGAAAQQVGFGDDVGAAAGLAWATARHAGSTTPLFCGDAIADPLTGLHAGLAAWAAWLGGGGVLLDVSMLGVVARCLRAEDEVPAARARVVETATGHAVCVGKRQVPVAAPRLPRVVARAAALGRDNSRVLREAGAPC